MRLLTNASILATVAATLVLFAGCGDESTSEKPKDGTSSQADEASHPEFTEEEKAEIAEVFAQMSDEDRALAEKQVICPVGGGPLGKMGVPPKVMVPTADGEVPVFICCEGCKEALLADPEKYLAKLPK